METPPRPMPTIRMDSLENPRTPLPAECSKAAGTEPNIQEGFTLPPDAPSTSQDTGGMMKIVPSELDVSSLSCEIIQQDVQNKRDLSSVMLLMFNRMVFLPLPMPVSHLVLLRFLLCSSVSSFLWNINFFLYHLMIQRIICEEPTT